MRSSFIATTGLKLARTPSARDIAHRRWLAVLAAVVGLAATSGVLGVLTAAKTPVDPPSRTGPFSYFPT